MADNSPFMELARQVLTAQPFSVLLGAQIESMAQGQAELSLVLRDDLKQQHGFVHGGVLSYLADNALTYAGGTALMAPVLTSEFKINYLRPALGQRLVVRARAVSAGKSQAVCQAEIFAVSEQGEEKLCAVAQGTIVRAEGVSKP